MHTIELDGRPIAIINAPSEVAEAISVTHLFRADLLITDDDSGMPMWTGQKPFEPQVRESTAEEVGIFERGFASAVAAGDAEREDREGYLVFLKDEKP